MGDKKKEDKGIKVEKWMANISMNSNLSS